VPALRIIASIATAKRLTSDCPAENTGSLQKAARALKRGGVGYYPKSDFVHVDIGRVRFW
jgi:hypothetical protein